MKVATLQFAPSVGTVTENIRRAEAVLASTDVSGIDWLVLPEMAFSGYNFSSLETITPYLEPTGAGQSTEWARSTASRLKCAVTVGYPEIETHNPHVASTTSAPSPRRFNSIVTVSPTGQIIAHYRKSFLYYTDETWAAEGDTRSFFHGDLGRLGRVSMGICMDINPYRFTAPWDAYEFARAAIDARSPTVLLCMAWITRLTPEELRDQPEQPDIETLSYWIERFYPLKQRAALAAEGADGSVVLVMANRCGQEGNVCYAGTSTVMKISRDAVGVFGILGKADEGCLVADLNSEPRFQLRPEG